MDLSLHRQERLLVFAFLVACFAYIFPDLFFLIRSPMEGTTLTLKDPTVSWSAFMPAFREFRYELLNSGNILWSNLRGMGQPILGNGVQGAPLFPLNIILLPLPDSLYWSVMPISRLLLIALAAYMIARKLIGFSIAASLMFALLIGFNINVTRWMNHPWSNGLLAGLWYLYFLCRVSTLNSKPHIGKACLGLTISVFAMISCGFPEASAMSAIIVVFLFGGWWLSHWHELKPSVGKILTLLLSCHFIGLALGSAQLLSLLEFIQHGGSLSLREGFAGGAHDKSNALSYGLAQFSMFWPTGAQQKFLSFSIGLFGLFFVFHGAASLLTSRTTGANTNIRLGISLGFVAAMTLFVVKVFALSQTVESFFAATPVLAQSHFPLYFSPLFYMGIAYFAAMGFESLLNASASRKAKLSKLFISIAAYCSVLFLCSYTMLYFNNTPHSRFWEVMLTKDGLRHVQVFTVIGATLLFFQASSLLNWRLSSQRGLVAVSALVILSIVVELGSSLPKQHAGIDYSLLSPTRASKEALAKALNSVPLPRHELRSNDQNGALAASGIATADNGVSAILSPELRQLRLSLFNAKFGGYIQLESPKTTWSYDALSANVWEMHATPISKPSWNKHTVNAQIDSRLIDWPSTPIPLANPFYLEGESWAFVPKRSPVEVWLNFVGEQQNFWLKTNLISQRDKGFRDGRYRMVSRWRLRIPSNWLSDSKFQVIARQVEVASNEFHDSTPVTMTLDRAHPIAIAGSQNTLIGASNDQTRAFFFRESALPRAYIASACVQAKSQAEEMAFFSQSNAVMQGAVVLPYKGDTNNFECENYKSTFQRVAISDDQGHELAFATITGPALLILNDSYYPGWQAFEGSGNELPIFRANTNARAVYLSESRPYAITMSYHPSWLKICLLLLALCIPITIFLWLYLKRVISVEPRKNLDRPTN